MSGTRSPSRTARATEPGLLIVAHGSPAAPDGPEAMMRGLAADVAALLPDWRVQGATLAGRGTLKAAVAALADTELRVFPHFMADGWFVSVELRRRLAAAGAAGAPVLRPLGLHPDLPDLCLLRALAAAEGRGWQPGACGLLLAAHGSPSDPRPRAAAEALGSAIRRTGLFRDVRLGFVDEAPFIADAARLAAPAICLPLFAGRAGHVETDLPEALRSAEFSGAVLDPIGTDDEVPAMIARTARQVAAVPVT